MVRLLESLMAIDGVWVLIPLLWQITLALTAESSLSRKNIYFSPSGKPTIFLAVFFFLQKINKPLGCSLGACDNAGGA
jgi:hypothetical protein